MNNSVGRKTGKKSLESVVERLRIDRCLFALASSILFFYLKNSVEQCKNICVSLKILIV